MGGSSSGILSPVTKPLGELATGITDAVGLTDVAGQKEQADKLLAAQREANQAMLDEAEKQREFEMQQAEVANERIEEDKLAEARAESREAARRRQLLGQQQSQGRRSTILTGPSGVESAVEQQAKTILGN